MAKYQGRVTWAEIAFFIEYAVIRQGMLVIAGHNFAAL